MGDFLFREAPKPNVFVFMSFMQSCYINGYFEFDVAGLFMFCRDIFHGWA